MFNMVPKCCTHQRSPAGVAVSSLLPVEDTPPPPPPLLPPSCLLHAAGFRKRKREYWCVFRKVWTSLTFYNQRYRYRQKLTVSYRKYTRILFYTVEGFRTTDVRSVQSFFIHCDCCHSCPPCLSVIAGNKRKQFNLI